MSNKKKKIALIIVLAAVILALGAAFAIYRCSADEISFTVNDTLPDGNGKTARVILLGGQSNASGCSINEYLEKNVSKEKYAEYKNGYDNVYINYLSGQNVSGGFVKCSTAQGELGGFFGPELGMAEKLSETYPGETFYIIKCAWGGTNLFEQWLSPSSKGKTGREYKAFVAFVQSSIDYLVSKGYDVSIEGMCWMQGESDSFMVETSNEYGEHLENFINDIRYGNIYELMEHNHPRACLGGYADFTQDDPRYPEDNRDFCLFKLDSLLHESLYIGDCGILTVTISPEDLKSGNVDKAVVDWDCC